jgi:NADH-quinone oxidoreductase subunit E
MSSTEVPQPGGNPSKETYVSAGPDVDVRAIVSPGSEGILDVTPLEDIFDTDIVAKAENLAARYPQSRSALLPMLHLVQSVQGYVSQEGISFCGRQLGLSDAEVTAVATFYTMYKRRPCGEHLGTDGKPLGHNETVGTPGERGSITLEHAECLAACDLGPVLQVNYEYYDNQTPEKTIALVDALREGRKPAPTRGAPLTDFKGAELQLAGFFPESPVQYREDVDGPSQAVETLRGAQIAQDRGWVAPVIEDVPLPEVQKK